MIILKLILIIAFINYILGFRKNPGVLVCGIVGFSGKGTFNPDKLRFLMLWNSVERGRDATGIFTPKSGVLKNTEEARKFFATEDYKKVEKDTVLIAHVRAKTVGANTAANAHPFTCGAITMVHNGTLEKPYALGTKYNLKSNEWDVDSQILAYGLATDYENNEEGRLDILSEYEGAAALLFYNSDTEVLYAYHDKKRPLFYGWDAVGDMYISSIKESLEAAECFSVEEFDTHTVYSIKDSQIIDKKVYKSYEDLHPRQTPFVHQGSLPFLELGKRGFPNDKIKSGTMVGHYFRSRYSISGGTMQFGGVVADVRKNKWYFVIDTCDASEYVVEVLGENGSLGYAFVSNFDTENFVPIKGDKVVFTSSIQSSRKKKHLWSAGDIAEVESSDFTKKEVSCIHPTLGIFTVGTSLIRLATEEDIENETPFVDPEPDGNTIEDLNEYLDRIRERESNEEEEEEEDEYIDSSIHKKMIADLTKLINDLENNYGSGVDVDITGNINEIKARLKNDFNFCAN